MQSHAILKIPFALFLLAPICAMAQTTVGGATLSGNILDPSGAGVGGARLTVTNAATGLQRASTSSEAGFYRFDLPIGSYDLKIEASGFQTASYTGLLLTVGAPVTVDPQLHFATSQESITVESRAPVVETARSSVATTVGTEAITNLPVNGRNFLDFTLLTPGVVADISAGDLSFAGQRGQSNTLLVDGADSNNFFWGEAMGRSGFRPYTLSEEAVQEFQINLAGYDSEIGRAAGGAINVVTRSGTNQLHGSAFEFYRDRGLNAATFIENSSGQRKQAYHYNQFGGSLGGPMRKDKLFYFASYDGQRNTSTQPVAPTIAPTGESLARLARYLQPYSLGLNNDTWLGKVDWDLNANNRVSVRYSASRFNGTNYQGAALNSALEHTGDSLVKTDNIAFLYTRVFGSRIVWNSRFNFVRDDLIGLANSTGVETNIASFLSFGKRAFDPNTINARSFQPVNVVSWVSRTHSFKAGADLLLSRIDNTFPGNFAGTYNFPSYDAYLAGTPSSYLQAFSRAGTTPPTDHPDVNELGLFIQDTWRAARDLTLTLGLRYDRFDYRQPTTLNSNPGLLAAGIRTDRIPISNGNIGPRVGLAWKPFGRAGTVVRAGYGIFYGRTPSVILNRVILQNAIDVVTYSLTSNLPIYPNSLAARPSVALAPPNIEVADPKLKSPATQQYNAQVEQAVGSGLSVTFGYLGVHGTHLGRDRDVNLYPSAPAQATFASGGTVSFSRHPGLSGPARPNPAFGRITLYDAGGDSRYNSGYIQIRKSVGPTLQLLASYTWSKVIDTNPDSIPSPGTPSYDAKLPQDTLLPNLDRGLGADDITHRMVLSGVWNVRRHWQVSIVSQVQSGRPFTIMTAGDAGNDGNAYNDRAPGVGRNTWRGPALITQDLRITRDIPLAKERVRLRLLAEGFDVLNRANFATFQMNQFTYSNFVFTPAARFLGPLSVYAPGSGSRVLQVAAKIVF